MTPRRTFIRPMQGWWWRDPYFMRFMRREATAPFVAAYAAILLAGLASLALGESEYNEWLEALKSPLSIAFHCLLVAIFAYHTVTWFAIMPKTMPPVYLGGKRVAGALITGAGIAAAALSSILIWILVSRGAP